MRRKLTINKFKKVTRKLYRGYPLYEFYGLYEEELGKEKFNKILPYLIEDKILRITRQHPNTNQPKYMLSYQGLNLVEQWNVSKLTIWIIILTVGLFVLGIIQIILFLLSMSRI